MTAAAEVNDLGYERAAFSEERGARALRGLEPAIVL